MDFADKYLKEESLQVYRPIIVGLVASVVIHLVFLLAPEIFPQRFELPTSFQVEIKPPPVKIRQATPEEIRRLKTVGIKDGAKDFSHPTTTSKQKTPPKKSGPQDLTDLKVTKQDVSKIGSIQNTNEQIKGNKSKQRPIQDEGLIGVRQLNNSKAVRLSSPGISTLPVAPQDALLLNKTDFNLGFIPPEGVNEDQLNSIEKIFFSFQKRTYESYVNAFISSYYDLTTRKPYLKNILREGEHLLRGRVVFDSKGNIETLEVLHSSKNDNVHELFEETLKNIKSLPNPPKQLLNTQEQLIIYYQLNVKN